ncbi:MAG: hypothetical protein HC840_00230 [Leptolyngbyaceae cyanobacterium RM2_2_4]|nr:hypothetical protein [Leptolyngbyaceae cyanobacterium RM2_2_4]
MSNRKPNGIQIDTIDRNLEYVQESFDLDRLDNFVTGLGVEYIHYKAMPSPIGQNDRGDYRRNDGVDTITSNGMIYRCAGKFTATMTDNSRDRKRGEAGVLDPSESKLVMPRFYNANGLSDGKRIYLSPGDRIYVADPLADVLVSNPQKMDYEPGVDNIPMFPIVEMEMPVTDSRNIEYIQGVDYAITADGNIRWLPGGKNPGMNMDTGKGNVYSVRYLYRSYWYITVLLKEVRVTNVTTNGERAPQRMPYHAIAVREYIYHNQNKGDKLNQLKSKDPKRVDKEPVSSINPAKPVIPVDMSSIGDDDEQS